MTIKGVIGNERRQKGCTPEESEREDNEALSHLPKSFQVFSSILEKARGADKKLGK